MEYNQLILTVLSGIASAFAALISYMNYRQSKRAGYSDVITKNRLKWIDDLRSSSNDFFMTYNLEPSKESFNQLNNCYFKLLLLFNSSRKEYTDLEKILKKYIISYNDTKIKDHDVLIEQIRLIAANSFNRAKDESGITKADEKKFNKNINKC